MEYPKIETLYDRDPKTFKVTNELRHTEYDLVNQWLVTEKVDGTNMRIELSPDGVSYRGKTNNSQIPTSILQWLETNAPFDKVIACFAPGTTATIFGEGYGVGIQKGGVYRNEGVSFRIFDVTVIGDEDFVWWLNWEDVEDVAKKLGMKTVPFLGHLTRCTDGKLNTSYPSAVTREERESGWGHSQEGIVCRTDPILFMRNGDRLIWKLKNKDLPKE